MFVELLECSPDAGVAQAGKPADVSKALDTLLSGSDVESLLVVTITSLKYRAIQGNVVPAFTDGKRHVVEVVIQKNSTSSIQKSKVVFTGAWKRIPRSFEGSKVAFFPKPFCLKCTVSVKVIW